ncbi:saccharopine dehydrogenase (NADP+, L-glutamate-forming) [Aspergillus novofumigatus IBT 16806]|uniref:Saccharopine dehydrogenase n=1 Tax=Aspergillus novofumigatus (strain IBT 16806) TaxID=1392255 RepID=A0A2I1C4W7_ASPN1|nr:saccharopine dehydrogenase [Aspergillus novofumigatus IBT 16806]PKX92643.1 saccharopine dehydrogenase [Aspergillus novofumigatus IBT 16806]
MVKQIAGSKVLLLGSGFVTKPTVEVLTKADVHVTVACRTLESAQKLCEGFPNTKAIALDVNDAAALDKALEQVDLAISLIPYTFHALVIKSAIRTKKHVVTTSYVSPAMMELDEECKKAGITVMNEIGLDPGIDHLYAVKTISEVHAEGGKITSFLSYCGGLPAPECSDNPLGYKFSWSSRGVLLALRNAAKFYKDGKEFSVAGPDLMATAKPYYIYPGYAFVAYPNRDSCPYRERYQIPEAQTVMIKVLVDIGFLSDEAQDFLNSPIAWKEATQKILGATSSEEKDLEWAIASKTTFTDNDSRNRLISGLRWIGLFSDEQITPARKMQYGPGERDMVMLQHKFGIEHKDGSKETRTSTLVEYGDPKGYSAMAKTVGVPCGVAVKLVLDGTISQKGVLAPMTWDICEPLLKTLKEEYGIEMIEKTI